MTSQQSILIFRPLSPQQCLIGFPIGLPNGYPGGDTVTGEIHTRIPSYGGFSSPDICNGSFPEIIHRKSSSMDSQTVAEHSRLTSMLNGELFGWFNYDNISLLFLFL